MPARLGAVLCLSPRWPGRSSAVTASELAGAGAPEAQPQQLAKTPSKTWVENPLHPFLFWSDVTRCDAENGEEWFR